VRVSFDFDDTLGDFMVRRFARMLMDRGIEVWVVTARFENQNNSDMYVVTDDIGIPRERIVHAPDKWKYFKDNEFAFHLDDNPFHSLGINQFTTTRGITLGEDHWVEKCMEAISS
jgi:hypothetical protein